jgi:pimeloyl-ACP methyl ester carboxylesterase
MSAIEGANATLGFGTMIRCTLSSLIISGLLAAAVPDAVAQTPQPGLAAPNTLKRSGIAKSSGVPIHYDVVGDPAAATPLLVLHGAYMSAEAMAPFVNGFAVDRPVIVVDQRGHGRTGDAPGPLTYEGLADDAAAVLDDLGVESADVLGYSMGGLAAVQLAVRHPGRVRKLVVISVGMRSDAWYAEVLAGVGQMNAAMFDGTPIRRNYDRLAPRPQDFSTLVEEIKALDAEAFDWEEAVRELRHPTMIIAGDYDVFRPEHAVEIFRMRGGGDGMVVATGVLAAPPPARLLILPGTTHLGIMAETEEVVSRVMPFLDDETPPLPPGFFQ